MKITVLNSTHDLKEDPKPYYFLFKDVRGNYLLAVIGFIDIYESSNNEEDLSSAKKYTQIAHSKFNKTINDVLEIMKIEKIKGKLLTLIKRLKKASNFDWTNLEKFKKFDRVYVRILNELKKLS